MAQTVQLTHAAQTRVARAAPQVLAQLGLQTPPTLVGKHAEKMALLDDPAAPVSTRRCAD